MKNIKIFYSKVSNLTSRPAIAKKPFFFIWPSLLILLRTEEMVNENKPLYYAELEPINKIFDTNSSFHVKQCAPGKV